MPTSIPQILSAICSFTRLGDGRNSCTKAAMFHQGNLSSHHWSVRHVDSSDPEWSQNHFHRTAFRRTIVWNGVKRQANTASPLSPRSTSQIITGNIKGRVNLASITLQRLHRWCKMPCHLTLLSKPRIYFTSYKICNQIGWTPDMWFITLTAFMIPGINVSCYDIHTVSSTSKLTQFSALPSPLWYNDWYIHLILTQVLLFKPRWKSVLFYHYLKLWKILSLYSSSCLFWQC